MDCRICNKPPSDRKIEYISQKTGDVVGVECESCEMKVRILKFVETGYITSRLWLHATLETYNAQLERELMEVVRAMKGVQEITKEFEHQVWFNGLQEFVRKSMSAAFSADTSHGSVLLLTTAGRALITLNGPNDVSVTLITDETSQEARMGIQGICATADQAKELIATATAAWKAKTLKFKRDAEIRLA